MNAEQPPSLVWAKSHPLFCMAYRQVSESAPEPFNLGLPWQGEIVHSRLGRA